MHGEAKPVYNKTKISMNFRGIAAKCAYQWGLRGKKSDL
jgi:hypothetical protein